MALGRADPGGGCLCRPADAEGVGGGGQPSGAPLQRHDGTSNRSSATCRTCATDARAKNNRNRCPVTSSRTQSCTGNAAVCSFATTRAHGHARGGCRGSEHPAGLAQRDPILARTRVCASFWASGSVCAVHFSDLQCECRAKAGTTGCSRNANHSTSTHDACASCSVGPYRSLSSQSTASPCHTPTICNLCTCSARACLGSLCAASTHRSSNSSNAGSRGKPLHIRASPRGFD